MKTGLQDFVAGESHRARIQGRDRFHNICNNGDATFKACMLLDGTETGTAKIEYNGDGTFDLVYWSERSGQYQIELLCNDTPLTGSPFAVTCRANTAHAASSQLSGDGLKGAHAGESAMILLRSYDRFGNAVVSGGEHVSAELRGSASTVKTVVTDNSDGTYTITYTATVANDYFLHVTVGDTSVGSALPVRVAAASAHASRCVLDGVTTNAVSGNQYSFAIVAHDEYGNAVCKGGDKFDVKIHGPLDITPAVKDTNDGHYIVSFVPQLIGSYHVTVHKDQILVAGCPLTIQCLPGMNS